MEKRKDTRRRILKGARLSFNNKFCVVDCVLRNITEHGAFLEFSDAVLVPDKFRLHNEMDGYDVDCEVVRRVRNSVGVQFAGEKEYYKPKRIQTVGAARSAG